MQINYRQRWVDDVLRYVRRSDSRIKQLVFAGQIAKATKDVLKSNGLTADEVKFSQLHHPERYFTPALSNKITVLDKQLANEVFSSMYSLAGRDDIHCGFF